MFRTLLLTLFIALPAQAKFQLEPYIGYHFWGDTNDGTKKHDLRGASYGGRLYYLLAPTFALGGDYHQGKLEEDGTGENNSDGAWDLKETGIFISYSPGVDWRFYVIYPLDYFVEKDTVTLKEEVGLRMGIGKPIKQRIMINLEFREIRYETTENELGISTTNVPAYKSTSLALFVSFPL